MCSRGEHTLKSPMSFSFLSWHCIMVASAFLGIGFRIADFLVLQNGIKAGDGTELCGQHCREGILHRLENWDPANLVKAQQGQEPGPVHGQSLSKCYPGWLIQAGVASGVVVKALFPPVPGAQRCEIQPSEEDEGSWALGHTLESK